MHVEQYVKRVCSPYIGCWPRNVSTTVHKNQPPLSKCNSFLKSNLFLSQYRFANQLKMCPSSCLELPDFCWIFIFWMKWCFVRGTFPGEVWPGRVSGTQIRRWIWAQFLRNPGKLPWAREDLSGLREQIRAHSQLQNWAQIGSGIWKKWFEECKLKFFYPLMSEASREVANLTWKKNPHTHPYMVSKNLSVSLSVCSKNIRREHNLMCNGYGTLKYSTKIMKKKIGAVRVLL